MEDKSRQEFPPKQPAAIQRPVNENVHTQQVPAEERINVHDHHLGYFNTVSGRSINFNNPQLDQIDTKDIAHALSNVCRFGGHCPEFYSVAQHSLMVWWLADTALKLPALLHDTPEAYINDMIKPLKTIVGKPYLDIEQKFESLIYTKFGLTMGFTGVKPFDKLALEIEAAYFWPGADPEKADAFPNVMRHIAGILDLEIPPGEPCWGPTTAKHAFLKALNSLTPEI